MLSQAELEFLKGETTLNSGYRRFLKHAVSKNLHRFDNEALPAILENDETKVWFLGIIREFSNGVRENSDSGEAQNRLPSGKGVVRLPEFESGLEAWEASVLDQARPQPHATH